MEKARSPRSLKNTMYFNQKREEYKGTTDTTDDTVRKPNHRRLAAARSAEMLERLNIRDPMSPSEMQKKVLHECLKTRKELRRVQKYNSLEKRSYSLANMQVIKLAPEIKKTLKI